MKTRTIKSLHKIQFPIFRLEGEPSLVDGLLFLNGFILDDRNVDRPTLGERRLLSPHPMYKKLNKVKFNIIDLIKDHGLEPWYIDNLGSVFKYRRTRFSKLLCHKIKQVVYKDTYSLIHVDNVNFPIIVNRPPVGTYAQILYYKDMPWKLYDIYYESVDATRKKV